MPENFTIRFATAEDCPTILQLITQLAIYEKMEDQVVATVESLQQSLFVQHGAETLLAEEDGKAVGFALFFHNYSTFLGCAGLHLEDVFVKPDCRGKGYGKALLAKLAALAVQRGCGRFEWACLDWNTPSIAFYKGLGAQPMEGWTTFRLTGEALQNLAAQGQGEEG